MSIKIFTSYKETAYFVDIQIVRKEDGLVGLKDIQQDDLLGVTWKSKFIHNEREFTFFSDDD